MTVLTCLSRWLCFCLLFSSLPLSAATLFFEDFNSDVMGQSWKGYNTFSVAGTPYGSLGFTTGIANSPTGQSDPYMYAQNNTPSGATTAADYFFYSTTTTAGAPAFASLVPADFSAFSASWNQNTGGTMTGMTSYLTVQVDGLWYATASGTPGAQNLYTVNLLTASWYAVSFTEGTSMSLNTAASTISSSTLFGPGEVITGLGFYVKNLPGASPTPATDYRTIRFDNLAVSGVPEPGRAALFMLSLGCLALRRRRADP